MSFQLLEYKFGDHRGLMIYCGDNGHHVDILPSHGALLSRVEFFNQEIMEPIESSKELENDHWYRNFWLLPFQNRIEEGQYTFEGKHFQLDINEIDKNNAIHGFFNSIELHDLRWEVEKDKVIVEIEHIYNGALDGFPFPFKTTFMYKILADGVLEAGFKITNTGNTKMPFAIGMHPYLKLDGNKSDWTITHGTLRHFPVDKRNLPTGTNDLLGNTLDLTQSYDHHFRFENEPYQLCIESRKFKLSIEQSKEMPYLQVFTPPRNSIALEPLSSGINAFNTSEGLQVIKPNETFEGSVKYDLSKK